MTKLPHTIGIDQTLESAKKMMYEFGIRHLPVLNAGKFEGIISDRDIKLAYAVDKNCSMLKVGDLINGEAYSVAPNTELKEVAQFMAKNTLGSCLIVENQKVIGIFTTTDACRVLAQLA